MLTKSLRGILKAQRVFCHQFLGFLLSPYTLSVSPNKMHLTKNSSDPSFIPSPCFCTETGPIDPVLIERYNTPGFIGCLSRVQFNGVAPLKFALRSSVPAQTTPTASQPDRQPVAASPVSYQGKLVESNCGASPLTIPPMSAATDPWHLENTGEDYSRYH